MPNDSLGCRSEFREHSPRPVRRLKVDFHMAQKLNKKLVFVVGSLLILLVIGGAGTLVLRYRYDADRHVREDWRRAAQRRAHPLPPLDFVGLPL
jgi:hypothetical protein